MTPERWARVKALFGAAADQAPGDRAAFLDAACGPEDADVRREVEALLAAHLDSDSFLETPAAALAAAGPSAVSVLEAGQTVGRYRLLGLLGAGGMGQVYLAEDPRLGRRVALKLLPRALSADPDRLRRFEQEARAASALSHPNVCVIHEIGEAADGRSYIAMEHVPGASLRQVLDEHRTAGTRLALEAALDVAQQMAAGLAAAHAAGVVHRDVKPENVMVRPDGLVKLLDFGLAKLAAREAASATASDVGRSVHTEPGMVLGTVQYMSPEQARGLPVDARTDVWSLGVVLYEMLAGRPPFEGATPSDVIVAVLDREPRPLPPPPELPPALAGVVARSLCKECAGRYEFMREMAADVARLRRDLEGAAAGGPAGASRSVAAAETGGVRNHRTVWRPATLGLVLTMLVGGGIGLAWWRGRSVEARARAAATAAQGGLVPASGSNRLAVLPFENLGRSEDAYLADGIADEVRGKLASLSGLQVIARSSSGQYSRSSKSPQEIARALGARYLLTGTVRADPGTNGTPGRLRVSPELVEVAGDGAPVVRWQDRFDVSVTDVFVVQGIVAGRVADALGVALRAGERGRLAEASTENLAAYHAYQRGDEVSGRVATYDTPTLRRAIRHYERAVALDSTFAPAWARLAQAHSLVYQSIPAADVATTARRAAERALALAPNRPEGWLALGIYRVVVEQEPSQAAEQFARGLVAAPNDPELLTAAGQIGWSLGRWDDALAHLRRAAALDPRSPNAAQKLGEGLLFVRRYPEAREALERALALEPANLTTLGVRAALDIARGDLPGARAVLHPTPDGVDPAALAGYVSVVWDLPWALDDATQRLLLDSRPEVFGDDRRGWGLALAQLYHFRGDSVRARAYADSARAAAVEALRTAPTDAQTHSLHGVTLAYLGRRDEAVREGLRGVALLPVSKDAYMGTYIQHQLARIYILAGESDKALDQLEPLLKLPYFLSPGWLRIDPTFAPLRGHPRFERLTAAR